MRPQPNCTIDRFRRVHSTRGASEPGKNYGYFVFPFLGAQLHVISSGSDVNNSEWEHISVSLSNRTPTWAEMKYIKEFFWGDDETVVQFHPKQQNYVNKMPYCLHLWKKIGIDYELPPAGLV